LAAGAEAAGAASRGEREGLAALIEFLSCGR
jgi:hypothetical protein